MLTRRTAVVNGAASAPAYQHMHLLEIITLYCYFEGLLCVNGSSVALRTDCVEGVVAEADRCIALVFPRVETNCDTAREIGKEGVLDCQATGFESGYACVSGSDGKIGEVGAGDGGCRAEEGDGRARGLCEGGGLDVEGVGGVEYVEVSAVRGKVTEEAGVGDVPFEEVLRVDGTPFIQTPQVMEDRVGDLAGGDPRHEYGRTLQRTCLLEAGVDDGEGVACDIIEEAASPQDGKGHTIASIEEVRLTDV